MSLIGCNSGPLGSPGVLNDVQQKLEITGKTTVNAGDEVSLGVNVLDPELAAVLDTVVPTYDWQQVSGPVVDIDDPTAATIHFTAPEIDDVLANVLLIVTISVEDVELSEAVKVTVFGSTSTEPAPTADAGSDLEVFAGDPVSLDGLNSTHPDGGDLEYVWTQTAGPEVELVDADSAVASFVAPTLEEDVTLTFSLLVTAGQAQAIDYVDVVVFANIEAASVDVVVDAGEDLEVGVGESVLLDGSKSYSLDVGELTFIWSQTAGTPVELIDADQAVASFVSPEIESDIETLVFLLTMEADDVVAGKTLTSARRVFTDEKQVKVNKGKNSDAPGQGGGGGTPPPPENTPPTVPGQNKGTIENNGVNITLNGSDADGDNLTFSVVSGPSHGNLGSINGNGSNSANVAYAADPNYIGVDSFEVKANDGTADSNIATVTVNVYPEVEFSLSVLDGSRPLAVTLLTQTVGGDPLPDGTYTWTVDGVEDAGPMSTHNQRSVVFNTAGQHTVSLALTLVGITGAVGCSSAQTGGLAGFATVLPQVSGFVRDGNGVGISGVTVVATNSGGVTAITGANGDYQLEVPFNWTGNIQPQHIDWIFAPTALSHASLNDDVSNQNFTGSASGNGNIGPVANAQSFQTDVNVPKALTLTGSDANNDPLTFSIVAGPTNGQVQGTPPNVTYYPNLNYQGQDSFTFKANDGTVDSNIATVSVTVVGNTAPVANNVNVQVTQNASKAITLSGSDADNDPLTFFIVTNPTNGTLTGTAPNLTYTPNNGYTGADSFTFVAHDGATSSPTATGSINVVAPGSWTPPIGIPAPEFGITEIAPAHPDNWNSPAAGFYYVDQGNGNATDSSNPYGSIGTPRVSIPSTLSAGDVVEIHGTYDPPGSDLRLSGNGTAANPIFVRGSGVGTNPVIQGGVRPNGNYHIYENLDVTGGSVKMLYPYHHVSFRHSEYHDVDASQFQIGTWDVSSSSNKVHHIVIYDNEIHHHGPFEPDGSFTPSERDTHGVIPFAGSEDVWILNNHIHHNHGDGIQLSRNGGAAGSDPTPPPMRIYIGGNDIHDNGENALDFKVPQDVIVSQNKLHSHTSTLVSGVGSDISGSNIVVQNDTQYAQYDRPKRIWFLYNEIYDGGFGAMVESGDEIYFVGNIIRNIDETPGDTHSDGSPWRWGAGIQLSSADNVYLYNNTVTDCTLGMGFRITGTMLVRCQNNIIANMKSPSNYHLAELAEGSGASTMEASATFDHNLFFQSGGAAKIKWAGATYNVSSLLAAGLGAGSIEADPMFVNQAANDFHLNTGSPGIDAGTSVGVDTSFFTLYGVHIGVDFDENARPQGASMDTGAYEK